MKYQIVLSKAFVIAAWLFFPLVTFSQAGSLPLKQGLYVRKENACKEPPLAAVMSWDGREFAGPHSSKCTSRILSHHGNQYSVSTTCGALGDGTPDASNYVENLSLTRLSATSFLLAKANEPQGTYRWCAAK